MRDITADWAFARYEAIRPRAPAATFSASSRRAAHLGEVAEHVDAFILDAFGVLNRGETAIPGAIDRMRELCPPAAFAGWHDLGRRRRAGGQVRR